LTPRLFTAAGLAADAVIDLDAAAAHHVVRVLRLGTGAAVELFDGNGQAASGSIVSVEPCRVEVHALLPPQPTPGLQLTLAQCLSAADKMDWTIEKAVELGVAAIVPLQSQKAIVKLSPERSARRREHWQRLILAAAAQSRQDRLPRLDEVRKLDGWLRPHPAPRSVQPSPDRVLRVILDPRAEQSLGALLAQHEASRPDALTLLCGPESGFSDSEFQAALGLGWIAAGLGPRVLRTETAGLAALAIVQARWGDLR